jgi:hypothetical protein
MFSVDFLFGPKLKAGVLKAIGKMMKWRILNQEWTTVQF